MDRQYGCDLIVELFFFLRDVEHLFDDAMTAMMMKMLIMSRDDEHDN